VSSQGAVLDGVPIAITTTLHEGPWAAGGTSEYLVAWTDSGADGGSSVARATRVALDGTVVDQGGITLGSTSGYGVGIVHAPSSGFTVSWEASTYNDYVATIDETTGAVSPAGGYELPGHAVGTGRPVLASNGSSVLVAWEGVDTQAALLGAGDAPAGTPVLLGDAPATDLPVALACSSTGCLAAWSDSSAAWAQPTGLDGTPAGSRVQVTYFGNYTNFQSQTPVSVVWTGSMYAVTWNVNALFAVRVKQDGTVVDAAPKELDDKQGLIITTVGGNGRLVEIASNFFSSAAVSTYDEATLNRVAFSALAPPLYGWVGASGVFLDATHVQVVWTDSTGLHGAQVDVTAANGAPATVTLASDAGFSAPVVARGQLETAVALVRPEDNGIAVYRLDASGALIDGPHETHAPAKPLGFSLAWDGVRYVLAWTSGDGSAAQASDLDRNFAVDGPLAVFTSAKTVSVPAIGPGFDGLALLAATSTLGVSTSIEGQQWSSTQLAPPPVEDAGPSEGGPSDAGAEGGDAGDDGSGDASAGDGSTGTGDAAPTDDGGLQSDAATPSPAPTDDAGADAGAPQESGGGASGGCSCLVARADASDTPAAIAGALVVAGVFARRRRRR
jgi:MYXO-CTERM domain-containing protein